MLRINAIQNTAAAKAYYRGTHDYYLEGQELPAYWHGKAADMLGLSGQVGMEQFFALCENQGPYTGEQLTKKKLDNRRVGYDFTWSVPKSVSLLYAIGGDKRIEQAFRNSVAETMADIEKEVEARVRKKGMNENRVVGNIVWSDFLHTTSRPVKGQPDPQLHIHATAFNVVFDPVEKQWKAGDFAAVKSSAPYFEAAFHARMANRLRGLGYEVQRKGKDYEVVGISPSSIKEFSRRTSQIEKLAEVLGVKNPESKAKLGATSREAKKDGQSWDSLVTGWRGRLSELDLTAVDATVASARNPLPIREAHVEHVGFALDHLLERKSAVPERHVATEALRHGVGEVTPEGVAADVAKRDLVRGEVKGVRFVSTQGVLAEEERIVAFAREGRGRSQPLRSLSAGTQNLERGPLGVRPGKDEERPHDTPQIDTARADARGQAKLGPASSIPFGRPQVALEASSEAGQSLRPKAEAMGRLSNETSPRSPSRSGPPDPATPSHSQQAGSGRGPDVSGLRDGERVERPWQATPPYPSHAAATANDLATLSPSQQATIRHVWNSRDRVIMVRGIAGSGKTTALKPMLAGMNVPWGVFATQSSASRGVLRDDGFTQADTIASLLRDRDRQEQLRGGLIVIDEASQTGAKELAQVIQLTEQLNARLLLLGDRRQHKSVSRGDVLAILERHAKLPVAEISDIKRQAGEYRSAVAALAAGNVASGFAALDKLGWVKESSYASKSALTLPGRDGPRSAVTQELTDEYLDAVKDNKSVLVVSPTNAEAQNLTSAIRSALRADGKLGKQEHTFDTLRNLNLTAPELAEAKAAPPEGVTVKRYAAYVSEKLSLATGDIIRATASIRDKSGKVKIDNGTQFTVTGFDKSGDIQVKSKTGAKRTLAVNVGHIAHAYVSTSHASQGRTVDKVLVWMPKSTFGAVSAETAYVSVSRGKQQATVYTDDREALFKQWGREDVRVMATDLAKQRRSRIGERMRKHLSLVRKAATLAIEKVNQLTQGRGNEYQAMEK